MNELVSNDPFLKFFLLVVVAVAGNYLFGIIWWLRDGPDKLAFWMGGFWIDRSKSLCVKCGIFLLEIAAFSIVVLIGFTFISIHYRSQFADVHPGLSKAELSRVVDIPYSVDTTQAGYEVWEYDVPSLFAERPRCFFGLGDTVVLRFAWEPIDTTLPGYSAVK